MSFVLSLLNKNSHFLALEPLQSNVGAKVVGEWSRFDYMLKVTGTGSSAAVLEMAALIPGASRWLYYRDEIGNVSTSVVVPKDDKLAVGLMPRFPLFGGWSAKFSFGWTVPMPYVVTRVEGGKVGLITDIGPAVRDTPVEELVVRVVLPEGASDVDVVCHTEHEQSHEKK